MKELPLMFILLENIFQIDVFRISKYITICLKLY